MAPKRDEHVKLTDILYSWMMNSLVVPELERALHAWLRKPLSHPTPMVNPLDMQSNLYKSTTLGTTQK